MKPTLIRITTIPISLEKLLHNQMHFMQKYFNVIAVSSNEEELKQVAKRQNVAYKTINMSRQITPLKDFIALLKMIVFFIKTKPQIVHTHTPKAGIVGMLAAKIVGVPNRLHTVAGLPLMEASGTKRKVLNFVEKLTYSCATKVYPNSKGLYDFILQEKFTSKCKLKVLGNGSSNGIDTSYFDSNLFTESQKMELKQGLGINITDFVYIFVGRLVKDKGINELVEAFVSVNKNNANTKLLLVGPLETELDPLELKTLNEIENNSNIISVGYQSDVRKYFAISNVLVFPSYREGFPNVVMQAGSMQLPAIVSNINGCNEIIKPNVNGIIIPVKKVEPIYLAMLNLYLDTDLYQQIRINSRDLIVNNYEQSYLWKQILNEYNKVLKNV